MLEAGKMGRLKNQRDFVAAVLQKPRSFRVFSGMTMFWSTQGTLMTSKESVEELLEHQSCVCCLRLGARYQVTLSDVSDASELFW